MYRIPKPTHDLLGRKIKRRKAFKMSTKKIEWMRAARRDPYGKFVKTSRCRNCGRRLIWGDRTYDFDHKDNNPANISQKNCYLVCKICHGRHTKITKRKVKSFGITVRYKTIKKKVGYKKPKKRKKKKKRKKRRPKSLFEMDFTRLRL